MRGLVLAVGMPRAGSGWHYNIIHDLIEVSGGVNAREIRRNFRLESVLTEVNCNIGVLSWRRLMFASIPVVLGNAYVIKAHSAPRPFARMLIRSGFLKTIYIYRDPRDALLSAYEYGKRMRDANRTNAFSHLKTIIDAIDFMEDYVEVSEGWLALDGVLHVRYEDLLQNYQEEIDRLAAFLGIVRGGDVVERVIEHYRPGKDSGDQKGLHFVKGKIGRYEEEFSDEEIAICNRRFGNYLRRMGYESITS